MKKRAWFLVSLFNLAVVALLGSILRTKILFPLPGIDHKNFINAHSHFAFGAWISLSFLALFRDSILPWDSKNKPWYRHMLLGLQISSTGMLLSFPFQGYGTVSIFFSTLFILFTYGYTWMFIKDIQHAYRDRLETVLSVAALICLIISSAGPYTLAYVLASGSANSILYKDSVYYYLHFQYNGFFTLAVFALLFSRLPDQYKKGNGRKFAFTLIASIIPSFFLTLLWHADSLWVKGLAVTGVYLLSTSVFFFIKFLREKPVIRAFSTPLALLLCRLVFVSFLIKTLLQAGTVVPELGHAVFGLRPIIIGFLHLVFLGLASFFILSEYIQRKVLDMAMPLARFAVNGFWIFVVAQETVLLLQGTGLLMGRSFPFFNWILWMISILLFMFALLMGISGFKSFLRPQHVINL